MGTTELRPEGRQRARGHAPVRLSRSVLSDEQLARAVSQGDRVAFATLYERYRAPLSRYCRSILRHPDDSADAFQNAMTAAFTALEREPPSGPLKPWLYRIAHNESIDLIRRRARASEELVAVAPEPAASSGSDVSEQLHALLADLRRLPERQRGALLMRELAGLEYDQIGRSFATSTVAARKLVYEARVTLGSMREGRDASCDLITRQISDGDGRTLRNRVVRTHLESCASCAAFERSLHARRQQLALVPALPVAGMGIWLATSIGGGAGATKALAGGGAVAGGAVAGTSAIGAGAGATAGGMVSSLGGAMAVKCLAVCGALAVAGAGAALATHTPRPSAPHSAPLTSAAVHQGAAAAAGSAQLRGAASPRAAGGPRAVSASAHATATVTAAGHAAAGSGGQHLRLRQLGSIPAAGHRGGATPGQAARGAGASPAPASAASTTPSPASTTASAPSAPVSATSTTASPATTTTSGGAGTGGASSGAPLTGASGSGTTAASSGAGSSRTSATSGTTLASGIAKLVEGSVASATSTANSSSSTIAGLLAGFLGGNATASGPGGAASTGTSSTSSGTSTTSSGSPLSGLFGRFSGD